MATRPKGPRAKKSSANKKSKKKAAAKKKKKSAQRKKAGKRKHAVRKGKRKSGAEPTSGAASSATRTTQRNAATKSQAATVARLYPKRIGSVSHYYPQSAAALIRLEAGDIEVGDTVHIRGHTTDFFERIEELRVDDLVVERAQRGQTVGIKLARTARENDGVFLLSS